MTTIRRVAVLGAGTMGSRIAAQFANAGIPAILLDINLAAAQNGLKTAQKSKPAAFFKDALASLITKSFPDVTVAASDGAG